MLSLNPRVLKIKSLKVIGFGSLTFGQKSCPSFGYASMIVYPSNKSLPREELVVILDAHYVGMEMSH